MKALFLEPAVMQSALFIYIIGVGTNTVASDMSPRIADDKCVATR